MSKDPNAIFQNLLDQIYPYAQSETHPDAFNVLRLDKLAKKLINLDPALAASARGLIAAVQGHLDAADEQHVLAKKLSRNPRHKMYQALSMRMLGEHESSYFFMQCIMKVMPNPVELLSDEIGLAFMSGHHRDVVAFHMELLRIKAEIPINIQFFIYFNSLIYFSEIDLYAFPEISKLIRSLEKTFNVQSPEFYLEEIEDQLFFWIDVTLDAATITEMNAQISAGRALMTGENVDRYHVNFRELDSKNTKSIQQDALHKFIHNVDFYNYQ